MKYLHKERCDLSLSCHLAIIHLRNISDFLSIEYWIFLLLYGRGAYTGGRACHLETIQSLLKNVRSLVVFVSNYNNHTLFVQEQYPFDHTSLD